ncbi:MAG TPA: bifunctional diguanylate cyclase/phosphodiesterase [Rhizobiaceae bacterium]|nr:bifunctional diguanylate cyclase/phosphodiesterase [Rhizobiaceae bacterium]
MIRVMTCLAYEHDYTFVLVAAVVCIAGSIMTMRLFDRAMRLDGMNQMIWILLSGVAGGTAIWTTHFVAMLGFNPPVEYAYEPVLTIASLVLAIIFTAVGLYIATRPRAGFVEIGGGVIGAGVSVMHFTGMAGYEVAGRMEWDWDLVAASIVLGIAFGVIALNREARSTTAFGKLLGALALVLAICTMHFTAMGAASFIPDPSVIVSPRVLSSEIIAIVVVAMISTVTGLALYAIDARSQREVLDGFRHAALHDALTGMPNRSFLASRLPAILDVGAESGHQVAVIVMDLDRFKDINDVHGHKAGDLLLQTIATRLRSATMPGEFVARMGGDEFIAVKQGVVAADEALSFAQRLTDSVTVPVVQDDRTLSVGASIGISLFPRDARTAEDLIGVADLAMYRAKKQAGNKICFYEHSMDEGRRTKSALSMELHGALQRNELVLHYQPQIDVKSGEIAGFEALLRWNHPVRGLVPPGEFIPIAEETGLILPIGEWVLRTACSEVAGWQKPYKLSVNIAAAQLTQSDLPRIVHEALLETGLAPSRLELEITEASIIEDLQGTLHVVRQLKALGVTIAMDDYGTGYSSLSTLQMFPFDKIKIDRSFVHGLTNNKASTAIVKATILLASNLDISVLAEGVERQEHFDFLRAEGCNEVQGFLFGRPQPLPDIAGIVGRETVLRESRSTPETPRSGFDFLPAKAVAHKR